MSTPRLIATVGIDIDDRHFDAGQQITGPVSKSHQKYLVAEGYAVWSEHLPTDVKTEIEAGAADPHSVEGQVDTKEE